MKNLTNQIALITGANVGIGQVTAMTLAQRGARVFLAGRSQARTQAVVDAIIAATGRADAAHWLPLDLADLHSVRACAQTFLGMNLPLHLLVNNAGLAGAKGVTAQGFEMAFGVNHLGHFELTQRLLDRIKASGPARIVTVASRAHRMAVNGIDWAALRKPTQSWTGVNEYAVSKLANILFSAELSRQLVGTEVSTYALHPGVVDTEVWRELPSFLRPLLRLRGLLTPEQGAQTSLYCATEAPAQESGLYYANRKVQPPTALAQDPALAKRLWEFSLSVTANEKAAL